MITIEQLGRLQTEGLGQIQWIGGYVQSNQYQTYHPRTLKIRKGLPHHLPQYVLDLIRYGILHDFFHNSRHKSKIYVEPPLKDLAYVALLKDHHDNKQNSKLVQQFQYYDRLAASITRKVRSPRTNRYNWKATKKINFKELAQHISEVSDNVWKLYQFIYQSKDLDLLNESMLYGHSSLKTHVLFITNLIVFDYLNNNLRQI